MAARYDHFHAIYEVDGEEHEMEGGWTSCSDRSKHDKGDWRHALCVSWGMPENAVIKRFWLAG